MSGVMGEHAVLGVLRQRSGEGSRPGRRADRHHVVLAIEGGGNRGVIPAGMALALADAGLVQAFDAVYGSSSGTLTGAWLLSPDLRTGLRAWVDPRSYSRSTSLSNPLRRRPLFDLEWLISEFYDRTLHLDAEHILANPIGLHPLATDAATGRSVDLAPFIENKESLHRAMRASAAVPILAGQPVELAGRRYLDAGLSESIPLDTPISAGATHLLVLSSRKNGEQTKDSGLTRWLTGQWLRRTAPGARAPFLQRNTRAGTVAQRLTRHLDEVELAPSILTIRPAPDTPPVSRRETDAATMRAAATAGQDAMLRVLG